MHTRTLAPPQKHTDTQMCAREFVYRRAHTETNVRARTRTSARTHKKHRTMPTMKPKHSTLNPDAYYVYIKTLSRHYFGAERTAICESMYACVCVCAHTHTNAHTQIHTDTQTHTHTHTQVVGVQGFSFFLVRKHFLSENFDLLVLRNVPNHIQE
jgi:hypothetical protein